MGGVRYMRQRPETICLIIHSSENLNNAWLSCSRADINRIECGMGMWATDNIAIKLSGQLGIVCVAPGTGEQPIILLAADRLPDTKLILSHEVYCLTPHPHSIGLRVTLYCGPQHQTPLAIGEIGAGMR